jgi:cell division protein FtsI (penicillin-binding protein 3)
MAFGYQVSFTPLQLLTFYNAIANNGVMVKPRLRERIQNPGRGIQEEDPEVLNPAVCSRETLGKLQALLEGVGERGTATNLQNDLVSIAGKTGTCQINYWKESTREYQASFAGYFPAEEPRYSCIVVINKPNYYRGYYGSTVAGPIFKAIAENIYADTPREIEKFRENQPGTAPDRETQLRKVPTDWDRDKLPDLRGLPGPEVLSMLENRGFEVITNGNGKVLRHYPPPGARVTNTKRIELKLG